MRIAIVSHFSYGSLSGRAVGRLVGGVEWQTSLTARWLAARGHDVSMLTWDEGGPAREVIDGVRVIKMCRQDAGLQGLRFFHPRWSSLLRALRAADAEVYYQNCGEYVTGQVAWWCRRNGRAFVYSVASDPDCDPALPEMKTLRERVLYRYGLRHADRLIVQTRRQQEMLRAGFGLESTWIPMPCAGPSDDEYLPPAPPEAGRARVAWV
ncbi:MAG: glycosyltransferase, partial [Phycisphaerae bacterium]